MNETRIESLRFSPVENTSTGTITTLSTHDTSMVFFTGAGAVTIESISYGSKGKVLKLANLTGSTLTLKHNTGSINKNRIITSDATDLVIQNNQIASLLYDHVNSRWKIDGAASSLPANRIPYGDGSSTYLNSERAKFNPAETFDAFTVAALTLGDLSSGIEAGIQLKPDNVGFLVTDKKTTASTNSRPLLIKSGDTSGTTSNSGAFTLKSGDVLTSGTSGNLSIKSGIGTTGTGTFASGSGNASAGSSGATSIGSGTGTTGTGNLTLNTGNASAGPSGSVNISTGTATGTRGSITLSAKDITVSAGAVNEIKGTDVPSAGTVDLTAATGNLIHITGTTTITAITLGSGYERTVVFDGALILTHNATTLILPSGANITTAAGDTAIFRGDGSGNTRCISYTKASGAPIVSSGGGSPYFDDDGGAPSVAPSAGGTDSIAIGEAASVGAGATNSFAIGTSAVVSASVTNSLAIGTGASAASSSGIAIGRNARVLTNAYAVAIGPGSSYSDAANASGNSSIALGRGTDATSLGAVALGWNAQATSNSYAVALGGGPITSLAPNATGSKSIAIGYGSDATAIQAIAIGNLAQATQSNALAIGNSSSATATTAIAIRGTASGSGSIAISGIVQNSLYGIAIGSSSNITAGSRNIVIGPGATTGQSYTIVIGNQSTSTGAHSIIIGRNATSSRDNTISIGRSSNIRSGGSIAIGYSAQTFHINSTNAIAIGKSAITGHTSFYSYAGIAFGNNAKAYSSANYIFTPLSIGVNSQSSANRAIAIGTDALASVENTVQIQGTSIVRKDTGSVSNDFRFCAANEAIVMVKEVNLKAISTVTLTVPTGSRFYPNEVGLILTTLGGTITLQPDVSFGITGTNNKFVTQTTSSLNAIYERDAYTPLTTTGESTLTFTVNVAATGSADIKGRAYFKGILVEIQ